MRVEHCRFLVGKKGEPSRKEVDQMTEEEGVVLKTYTQRGPSQDRREEGSPRGRSEP